MNFKRMVRKSIGSTNIVLFNVFVLLDKGN